MEPIQSDPTGEPTALHRPPVHLRPLGLLPHGLSLPHARPLAGGWLSFDRCEVAHRNGKFVERRIVGLDDHRHWAVGMRTLLDRLSAPRPAVGGLSLDRPRIMGILNVTPDSFFDGGLHADEQRAVEHGIAMMNDGADIIDVGAESTRPGARPIPAEEQMRRAIPVLARLVRHGAIVSIDTRSAAVMRAALDAGATILNDVSALSHDPDSLGVAATSTATVVLMHMRGVPETMNAAPAYVDTALDVFDEIEHRLHACKGAGIPRGRILVDPGIGFAKTMTQGASVARALSLFHGTGCGVLVGFSRKGLIKRWADGTGPDGRLPGSLAAALAAFSQGVQIVRVHDVAATAQARDVWEAFTSR